MKKQTDEELGRLLTKGILTMLQDERIDKADRFDMLSHILFSMDIHSVPYLCMADALKTEYVERNSKYLAKIKNERAAKAKKQREYVEKAKSIEGNGYPLNSNRGQSASIPLNINKKDREDIPLNPPSGVDGGMPPAISIEDLIGATPPAVDEMKRAAAELAEKIENTEAFARMRVNRGKLMKCLISILKKNGAREGGADVGEKILSGLKKWTASWAAEDWKFVPGKVTDWLYDEKWLEEPRKKSGAAPAVGSGCGECGVEIA